jgi:hypothetical protein
VAKYHKLTGTDTWHWSRSCSRWPGTGADTMAQDRPPSYDLCKECALLESQSASANATEIDRVGLVDLSDERRDTR